MEWPALSGSGRRCQTECHHRIPARASGFLYFLDQIRFPIVRVWHHLVTSNLFVRNTVIAELARTQSIFGPNRWAEHPAGHRTRFVQVARSIVPVECRARLFIRKCFETLLAFFRFIQNSRDGITREFVSQPSPCVGGTRSHRSCLCWILPLQLSYASPQPLRIKLTDGKHADAALRASLFADEQITAPASRIRKRRIHNLNQLVIGPRWISERHVLSITQASRCASNLGNGILALEFPSCIWMLVEVWAD